MVRSLFRKQVRRNSLAGSSPVFSATWYVFDMGYKDAAKQRAYQREWVRKRRAAWLHENGPCACGSWESLEVDHVDPAGKVTHAVWSWSAERRGVELAKCQVLCARCHLRKTLAARAKTDHGRGQMYIRYKCRCDKCRAWKRDDDFMRRGKPTGDGTSLETKRA